MQFVPRFHWAALALLSLPFAITTTPLATAAPVRPQPTSAAASGNALAPIAQTLEPIEVKGRWSGYHVHDTTTATRTDTPLIDIPQTIQAIPIELLKDQGAKTLEDAMRNAPGVYVQQGEGNRDELMIRGIKTKDSFFINGVRDDTEYFRDLYNVQEVDVLQGPAALLFGRGNAGGLVNLVTKRPLHTAIRHLGFDGGSYGFLRATLDLNQPVGGHGAFRINAVGQKNGGDFNFRNAYFEHRYGVDPEFKFWLGSHTTVEFGASDLKERERADRGIPSQNGRPVDVPRARFFGSPTQNHARNDVEEVHARINRKIGDHLRLHDSFRVSRNIKFYQNMYPGSAVANDTLTITGYHHGNTRTSWLNHADIVYDTRIGGLHHQLLMGLDVGYQRDHDWEDTAPAFAEVPLADPTVTGHFDIPGRNNNVQANFQNLYAEDQIRWGAHWKALVGLAWERFDVRAQFHLLPAGRGIQHTDSAFTPRVGLIYQPTPNDSLYASVSRTFTPQGANLALSLKSPKGANLDPQTAINYEVGNKLDLFGQRLALTAALFQLDLQHVVNTDPNDPTRLVQTGAQRNHGFEFSAIGNLTPDWSIAANYTYLDARITHATQKAPAGARAGLVPSHQVSIWTRYDIDDHWGIGAGVLARSRVFTSYDNQVVLPGYAVAGAMAYYQRDDYRIQLNVKNLFNRLYYATANGDNQIMPGAPRTAMLRVRVDF